MNISISGFDDFKSKLDNLQDNIQRNAERLNGQEASYAELFSPAFMSQYTDASSLDELLQKGGFQVETPEDFTNIPEQEMDSLVAVHTDFPTWDAMLTKASEEWFARQFSF